MSSLQPARGTHDLIGDEARRHAHVINIARRVTARYGYEEWSTPIFEDTRVFSRTLGDTSDVVTKEMYSFEDRGGESLTLRPEGTAAICRAFVSNGLTQKLPQRVFYNGPMFRYERPQKGRFRQFHQIGAEYLGSSDPLIDAETIAMAQMILRELGLEQDVSLQINTLGDVESRLAWRKALIAYFVAHQDALSEESRARLHQNPLRIIDSKSSQDRTLLQSAPSFSEYLNPASRVFYDGLRRGLDLYGVAYTENPHIVRGLDYYSHTAFEFLTEKLGAQGTVLAGGRYEGLVAEMGGPSTPAIGWAGGIERLALLIAPPESHGKYVVVLPMGEAGLPKAISLLQTLREGDVRAEMALHGAFKKRMERAIKGGATHLILIGEDELAQGRVIIRDLSLRAQRDVPINEALRFLTHGA
ncbi:histidine--tRNA ligase [Candidatus Kirkpatrickella diaphorinae]|uniref:Histidine--tRNA ligase n=1 Tax=Candidatus Kirkpatrickella diaphorinae TaxID=2984322 RepID=A0ABY6GKI4_9PROT|nr:histidine--tRNA ligase [Candidatus Kirkpatrickella diaphorinae]UYH51779.1 histidine--tRNA ligase [Candidatus Kirkpatrickella diaphorinae]